MGNPREEARNWQPKSDKGSQHVTVFAQGGDNGQYGVWAGLANHTNDPCDRGIVVIADQWWEYLDRTSLLPKEKLIVTIERQKVPEISTTSIDPDAELKKGSEMEMVAALATEEGIHVDTIEPRGVIPSQPEDYVEATYLANKYPMWVIPLHYTMRFGPQMHRAGIVEDPAVRRYLGERLSGIKQSLSKDKRFTDADFSVGTSLENFYTLYRRPFSVRTLDDVKFLRSETFIGDMPRQPEPGESIVRQAAREVDGFRNHYSFHKVYKPNWEGGLSNFSVVGEPHLLNQEPDIKSLGTEIFSFSQSI